MLRVVVHGPGGYDRLRLESGPDPRPQPGQILVATRAVGVNYADCCVRWGVYRSARERVGWPITPGFEFAGTVVESVDSASSWVAGDLVFGVTLFGGYSSHVVVPEQQLFPLPEGWSFEEAAGFPAVFLTAYHALFQNFRITSDMSMLIHSAAGGVGTALLQLAKIAGCRTVGVVGAPHKVEVARRFGADEVIDKSRNDLWREASRLAPDGYDAVLDANGPATLRESYKHLAPTGKLVVYGFHTMLPRSTEGGSGRLNPLLIARNWMRVPRFNPLKMTGDNRSVIAFNLSFLPHRGDLLVEAMGDLLTWVREGRIRPPAVTRYPLDRVADAHRDLESGGTTGKLVLTVGALDG
jgi:NADPH:quinone reductase-like Zn-dependent oxidoreductase